MKNLIRQGIVSAVYPERCSCRVTFPDRDNLVSAELPILQPAGEKNHFYTLPDVDDRVLCLMLPNDPIGGNGFVLGSFYHDKKKPPANSQDKSRIEFADGTSIEYDRATHKLNITCAGELNITCAKDIKIKGRNIFLND